ncbi:MAG: DHH family phosphoesterase [Lachnospiraceae bacterium]
MRKIEDVLEGVKSIGIAGHVRPDGDSIGSCMALYLYLKKNYPQIDVTVYIDNPKEVFFYLKEIKAARQVYTAQEAACDLFITLDVSAQNRIGVAAEGFAKARKTLCIDHHISNPGFADMNYICSDISSTAEALYGLLDSHKIDADIAEAIYTGIIHDTGVFQYASTTPDTMCIAGQLMKTGFNFSRIIDASFYQKTYLQIQILGRVLAESMLLLDGRCVLGVLDQAQMNLYKATTNDLEGIVSQLRLTKGVNVAIFIYEYAAGEYKVSLRSDESVNVSAVAAQFGGGGHVRAAGCDLQGTLEEVRTQLTECIRQQL